MIERFGKLLSATKNRIENMIYPPLFRAESAISQVARHTQTHLRINNLQFIEDADEPVVLRLTDQISSKQAMYRWLVFVKTSRTIELFELSRESYNPLAKHLAVEVPFILHKRKIQFRDFSQQELNKQIFEPPYDFDKIVMHHTVIGETADDEEKTNIPVHALQPTRAGV